jgi:VCBS repeat-containing protein
VGIGKEFYNMTEYISKLEIDKKDPEFAYLTITDNQGNYGTWTLNKTGNTFYIVSFIKGKVNNTEFAGDLEDKRFIKKSGRGRASKESLIIINEIQREACGLYNWF